LIYPSEKNHADTYESSLPTKFFLRFNDFQVPFNADYPLDELGEDHFNYIREGTKLYCLRIGKYKSDKKEYYGDGGTKGMVTAWEHADLLVLQILGKYQMPAESIDEAFTEGGTQEAHRCQRVGHLQNFRLTEEQEEEIFLGVDASLIELL
jgi:hypothetical protein